MQEQAPPHYLEQEVYELVASDLSVFGFLEGNLLDGLWYWDLESPEHEWMSPRFWEVLGYDHKKMPHKSAAWQDIIFPNDNAVAQENFERHLADPSHPYDQVVRYRHADGSTVWVRCKGMVVRDASGKATRMMGVHSDVTELAKSRLEQEELNRQLAEANRQLAEANQQLARANGELQTFAWAASHDLKSPLRGVSQLATWLEEDLEAGNLDDMPANFELLKGRVKRLGTLLDDLLIYARSGTDIAAADIVPIDVAALVAEVWELTAAPEAMQMRIEGDLGTLSGPRSLLERVLLNLVGNAVKHHPGPTGQVVVRGIDAGDFVRIEVADDGSGIDEKYRERVFRLFEQLQSRDDREGSGVGLALVQRSVMQAGGTIELGANTPHGAVFSFTWPRVWPLEADGSTPSGQARAAGWRL